MIFVFDAYGPEPGECRDQSQFQVQLQEIGTGLCNRQLSALARHAATRALWLVQVAAKKQRGSKFKDIEAIASTLQQSNRILLPDCRPADALNSGKAGFHA